MMLMNKFGSNYNGKQDRTIHNPEQQDCKLIKASCQIPEDKSSGLYLFLNGIGYINTLAYPAFNIKA